MTPRPLYKWKCFWLGILVLGFLGWAWWDSSRWETQVHFFTDAVQVVHARGELWLLHHDNFWQMDWSYFYAERNFSGAGDWNSWRPWEEFREYGFEIHKVPHWFLMLLIVVPWLAFLFWRVMKQRRLSQ